MEMHRPVILLASERSGTNLLRAIVCSHSAVASPPPCGFVGILANTSFRYLPPLKPPLFNDLILDAIAITQTHFNPWDVTITPEEVSRRTRTPSFWGVFQALNEIYAEQKGCKYWFSKEPDLFRHIYAIKMHLPEAKFVYLVRDGRDVAASMLKGGIHEYHIFHAARRWVENQRYCLSALADPLMQGQLFLLKYEDLVIDPEKTGRQLMDFIGLDFEQSQLDYFKNREILEHAGRSALWENIAKPVDSSSVGNYRKFLSPREIRIFESIAWHEMAALNYSLKNQSRRRISTLEKGMFTVSAGLRRLVGEMSGRGTAKRHRMRDEAVSRIIDRTLGEEKNRT